MGRKTPEGRVKERIKEVLDSLGENLYYCMPIGTGYGNSGVPDFIVCYRGAFVALEAKANGGKPTALQDHHLKKIDKAGGLGIVVDETNVDDLRNIFAWWHTCRR